MKWSLEGDGRGLEVLALNPLRPKGRGKDGSLATFEGLRVTGR